jgi:hypothetical protein
LYIYLDIKILSSLQEVPIETITVDYDWNTIMTTPQLVCYDKSQWKTLQQLANWNREWSELFASLYYLQNVNLRVRCSWMDDKFARSLLEEVSRLPNINKVNAELSAKASVVQ